jgi:hypothetical protein
MRDYARLLYRSLQAETLLVYIYPELYSFSDADEGVVLHATVEFIIGYNNNPLRAEHMLAATLFAVSFSLKSTCAVQRDESFGVHWEKY